MTRAWSSVEEQFLRENLCLSDREIAARLGRTEGAVQAKRLRMRLFRRTCKPANHGKGEWDWDLLRELSAETGVSMVTIQKNVKTLQGVLNLK